MEKKQMVPLKLCLRVKSIQLLTMIMKKLKKNFMKGDYFSVVKLPWEQTFYDSGLSQVNLIQQGKNWIHNKLGNLYSSRNTKEFSNVLIRHKYLAIESSKQTCNLLIKKLIWTFTSGLTIWLHWLFTRHWQRR